MHYQVFPWSMGPLNLLESITKVPDLQVAKWANRLSSDFLSFSLSHASMIMGATIKTIQTNP